MLDVTRRVADSCENTRTRSESGACLAVAAHPLIKLPLLYIVTGISRVSMAVRADVIWMRTVYFVEMMELLMVVHSVGMVIK